LSSSFRCVFKLPEIRDKKAISSLMGCELNRSMQHLSLKMKAEDVAYGQTPTTKILL
jgi:hypothetical protein